MPGVITVHAKVNPHCDWPNMPNRRIPALQKLFFACPNLKAFTLRVSPDYGGCTGPRRKYHPQVYNFELSREEIFPPLESLSLDGYSMRREEAKRWRDGLDWEKLTALRLGPNPIRYGRNWTQRPSTYLLKFFTGHAKALRNLKIEAWAGEGDDDCPVLEEFLMSFDTLEEISVRGHFVSSRALGHHPRLKRLALHTIELQREGARRPTLDAADLSFLDESCLDLETMEIDIHRDEAWVSPRSPTADIYPSVNTITAERHHKSTR